MSKYLTHLPMTPSLWWRPRNPRSRGLEEGPGGTRAKVAPGVLDLGWVMRVFLFLGWRKTRR